MTRAAILRRLEKLEASLSTAPVQRLTFIDVTKLPDAERDVFWRGDRSVLDRHAEPGTRSIIVDIHEACRDSWMATRDMTDEERESHELELDRREAAERAAAMRPTIAPVPSESRPRAVWGYGPDGQPIYDDDPRFADGIGTVVRRISAEVM